MRNSLREDISQHSLDTAFIAHALSLLGNRRFGKSYDANRAATLAIFHDVSEIITGDMPTPIKYHSPLINSAYKEVERVACDRLASMLPDDLRDEYSGLMSCESQSDRELLPLIKAADKLSALIKCIEEKKSGNREFEHAERSLRSIVRSIDLPEVQCFTEEFLPSYSLTLDELNQDAKDEPI